MQAAECFAGVVVVAGGSRHPGALWWRLRVAAGSGRQGRCSLLEREAEGVGKLVSVLGGGSCEVRHGLSEPFASDKEAKGWFSGVIGGGRQGWLQGEMFLAN
ncbi:hypothetical protein AXG93_4421s1070 [Marchantia polymorpha subsp. ruderalis]|uniref:Uncharacterized protein n=1 Tax=Marchantia polymorpha subsp. ruderalis TaxID=1480154 RepID=A0A176WIF7_MARPO|nr:hypothetical protein AXG93_4421s1070 [Marchantia polymorpha subsp. ruderalis]